MGLFKTLASGFEAKDAMILDQLPSFLLGPDSKTGIHVSYSAALRIATVFACLRVIAEGVAQVPCEVFKARSPGPGDDVAKDHPLYRLLYRKPNGWQTAFEFRETLMIHAVLAGNGYAYISRVGSGRIHELIPLEPGRVAVTRQRDMTLVYDVNGDDGRTMRVPATDMWHLRGPSWNSWMGMETLKLAREALGLSLALEESHALLHKNGAQVAGTYSIPGNLGADRHAQLSAWIKNHAQGLNKHLPLILDNGATWLAQQMTGVDAQHLETRKHQIEEVCRFMRVFPQMVGHAGDQTPTFASAEAFFTAHVMHTLHPWCERIEQSGDVNLLGDDGMDQGFFIRHNLRGLMRGSLKDQAEYFSKGLGAGGGPAWLTQDDCRIDDGRNPMGGKAAELREPTNTPKPGDPKPADPAPAPKENI